MIGTFFLVPAALGFAAGTVIGLRIVAASRRREGARWASATIPSPRT